MKRKMRLPAGWYAREKAAALRQFEEWERSFPASARTGRAAVAPHAGWFFSGETAWRALRRLAPTPLVAVLGGHLAPGDPILAPSEDFFETPLGELRRDEDLFRFIQDRFSPAPDHEVDNTVEIQLPIVHRLFPGCRLICLRVPPSSLAAELGAALAGYAGAGSDLTVIASTDLTHYGPNYGFMPRGSGAAAVEWVRNHNDRRFIDAALALDPAEIVRLGLETRAACSPGAAAAAAAWAAALGLSGELEAYATSLDKHSSPSFVGYAGLVYSKKPVDRG